MANQKPAKTEYLAILEGLLFLFGDEGLSFEMITIYLRLSKQKMIVQELLTQLQNKYVNDSQSGLKLVQHGNIYKITTKEEYHNIYQAIREQPVMKLSQAALETLAIISYKQPVTKPQIEEIRGVNCDSIMNKLKQWNLIIETGRSDLPGRPILYEVTNQFLDQFQMQSLEQLPELPDYQINESEKDFY